MSDHPQLPQDPLSLFSAPICAIGSHAPGGRPNAQIGVCVGGASIVPDRPRLQVVLWKNNYTCDLAQAAGTLAVTVLDESQAELVAALGLQSGRDVEKLAAIEHDCTPAGDPWFPGGIALLDCTVLAAFDLGDAVSYLVAVDERRWLGGHAMLSRAKTAAILGPAFQAAFEAMTARSVASSRERMLWR